MKLVTKNFLKKVINRYMPEDSRYQKIIQTLLIEKRKTYGNILSPPSNSLYLYNDNKMFKRPPTLSGKMRYQKIFDLLEKKGIIIRDNYYYAIVAECRPYLEGRQKFEEPAFEAPAKMRTGLKLSDQEKKEIRTIIKTELRKLEHQNWVNRYSQPELDCLVKNEINALIDCYEKNKTVSSVW